jgi:hypothetical protein
LSNKKQDEEKQVVAFAALGKKAHDAHVKVKTAFKSGLRKDDPLAYQALLTAFGKAQSDVFLLIFKDGTHFDDRIRKGDNETVDGAIAFLTADPYFFRSGYMKQVVLRRLKQAPLTRQQTERLQTLVLDAITQPHRFQFADYARLAAAIASTDFLTKVEALCASPKDDVRARALRVFELAKQGQKAKGF